MSAMSQREYQHIVNRQRRLPVELERARHRVRQLEAEAQRYGMKELLTKPAAINDAWERTVEKARCQQVITSKGENNHDADE